MKRQSLTGMILYSSFVQLVVFIVLSITVAEILLIVLSYYRFSLPIWLDELLFNPILLIVLLSPFTAAEGEISLLVFDPTLFAIVLSPVAYFVLFRPWMQRIAEREKAEEMRIERERIEYARRVKNEFIANLGHEMRTHLNSIIGFSELLKTAGLNEKQQRYVSNILKSGNLQLVIISDLLDLSKVEAGKMELSLERIYVPEVIDEALAPLKETAERQKVMVKKELDSALEFMEADRYIFKQVMYNLLSNAIKFSKEEGGVVTITTRKVDGTASFSVRDSGIGIRKEDLERVFNQFPHIDTGARKFEGTGLGLALSKQLVELHGGRIRAESMFGEGSTFTFALPIEK